LSALQLSANVLIELRHLTTAGPSQTHARRREIGRYPIQRQNEEHLHYTETWLHLLTINFQKKIVTGTVILNLLNPNSFFTYQQV
jgi:hypothetical protein